MAMSLWTSSCLAYCLQESYQSQLQCGEGCRWRGTAETRLKMSRESIFQAQIRDQERESQKGAGGGGDQILQEQLMEAAEEIGNRSKEVAEAKAAVEQSVDHHFASRTSC